MAGLHSLTGEPICLAPPVCSPVCWPPAIGLLLTISSAGSPSACFADDCHHHGLAAKAYLAFGTDPIEELTNLAEKIYSEFPHSIFFTSKLFGYFFFEVPSNLARIMHESWRV
jgi:hypothetical protein